MKRRTAKKVPKYLKRVRVTLDLSVYEGFLLMDALAGFKPTKEWEPLYQAVGVMVFAACPEEKPDVAT